MPQLRVGKEVVKGHTFIVHDVREDILITDIDVFKWKGKIVVAVRVYFKPDKRRLLEPFERNMLRGVGFSVLNRAWEFKDEPLRFYVGRRRDWENVKEGLAERGLLLIDVEVYKKFLYDRYFRLD